MAFSGKLPGLSLPGFDFGKAVKMVFRLGSGQTINLCGWRAKGLKDTVYQGYELFFCGQSPFASSDETGTTMIHRLGDTLSTADYAEIPIGTNFRMVSRTFYIRQFFFRGKTLIDTAYYRSDLPLYSRVQIQKILREYSHLTGKDNDSVNLTAHRLFWAVVSGSATAEACLRHIKSKFSNLDGAVAEEFEETWATYLNWKEKNRVAISHR